jgi:hypothetical protein
LRRKTHDCASMYEFLIRILTMYEDFTECLLDFLSVKI